MTPDLRVLVVDDHPVVRRGLRTMLEGEHWVGEVVEAATVADAVRQAVSRQVHVVAMDMALPDGDGMEATRRILRLRPEARVLMLTIAEDEELVVGAMRAGAHGYLLKDTDPDIIVDALRTVAGGGFVLGPGTPKVVFAALDRGPAALAPPFDKLTPRELQLLSRLAAGDSNTRIALHLGLSEKTVRNQLSGVFNKLGVTDRVKAALLAREAGFGR